MSLESIAGQTIVSAGWIAIGAAVLFSRHRKATELAGRARAESGEEPVREYHRGFCLGAGGYREDTGIAQKPEAQAIATTPVPSAAPAWTADLAALAAAIDKATPQKEPVEKAAVK